MQFVYPAFLSALFVIAIPLVVHLFNFRKLKRVYFSNVAMLENIEQETKSVKNIKRFLILMSRILAFTFLVLAFAQPFIPGEASFVKGGTSAIGIYIDNSNSMNLNGVNGNMIEEAKKKAKEIAMSFNSSDKFQLLTNDFEGKHQRFVNREEFLSMLDEVKVSSASKDLSEVVMRQNSLFSEQNFENKFAYYFSDYQKSQFDFKDLKSDNKINGNIIPLNHSQMQNVFVDSLWFEVPYHTFPGKEKLFVKIKSSGKGDGDYENITLKLFINGVQKSLSTFQVNKGEDKIISLDFSNVSNGVQNGYVAINDQYVNYDDVFYFSYFIKPIKKVLSIGNGLNSATLNKLFSIDSYFEYNHNAIGSLDYSSLQKYDLIVLEDLKTINSGLILELKKSLQSGTNIFTFIGKDADINSYNNLFSELGNLKLERADTSLSEVKNINSKVSFFEGIFEDGKLSSTNLKLPTTNYTYKTSGFSKADILMSYNDKSPFISSLPFASGIFYTCYAPLDRKYSDFSLHSLFVPILFQSALIENDFQKLYYVIGKDKSLRTKIDEISGDQKLKLKNLETNFEIIPSFIFSGGFAEVKIHSNELPVGNYNIMHEAELLKSVSFNQSRKESEMLYWSEDEIERKVSENNYGNVVLIKNSKRNFQELITEQTEGKRYWKECLMFVLFFLILEMILIVWGDKFLKLKTVRVK